MSLENIGGKTPEDSSEHMPLRLSEKTAIQQVLETSADAEFGLMSMPEWARERQWSCARQAILDSYLGSVEEPGQEVIISDSGSCEEHDEPISGHV